MNYDMTAKPRQPREHKACWGVRRFIGSDSWLLPTAECGPRVERPFDRNSNIDPLKHWMCS